VGSLELEVESLEVGSLSDDRVLFELYVLSIDDTSTISFNIELQLLTVMLFLCKSRVVNLVLCLSESTSNSTSSSRPYPY